VVDNAIDYGNFTYFYLFVANLTPRFLSIDHEVPFREAFYAPITNIWFFHTNGQPPVI